MQKTLLESLIPHGVALYCMVGPRARKGEAALLGAGYSSVLHLGDGLAAWQAAGLPVENEQEAVLLSRTRATRSGSPLFGLKKKDRLVSAGADWCTLDETF